MDTHNPKVVSLLERIAENSTRTARAADHIAQRTDCNDAPHRAETNGRQAGTDKATMHGLCIPEACCAVISTTLSDEEAGRLLHALILRKYCSGSTSAICRLEEGMDTAAAVLYELLKYLV